MKALYRKYRPTKLSDVVAQEQVKKPLEEAIKTGKISHAYLFAGPRGCGKTSVARIFAHEINKFKYEVEDSYVDIVEIDAASNTGVDNIRELREKAVVAPTKGKYKVYIIDEIHMLTKSAFNALLKTLEEPPKSVVFIMATTDVHKVPDTIISRAQVFNFNLADKGTIKKHLKKIAEAEKIKIDSDALDLIVGRGGGSFRDSISLLDQISTISTDKIKKEDVLQILGLPDEEAIKSLLIAYEEGDITKITELLHVQLNSGKKPEILAENLIAEILKEPKPKLLPLLEQLPEVRAPYPEAKILMAFLKEAAIRPVMQVSAPNSPSSAPKSQNAFKKPVEAENQPKKEENLLSKETTKKKNSSSAVRFDKNQLLEKIRPKNIGLHQMLTRSTIEQDGTKIMIFAKNGPVRDLIEKKNNFELIMQFIPEKYSVEVLDLAEHTAKMKNLSKISDIMGEVTEVETDGNPF